MPDSGPEEAAKGTVEGLKGQAKEFVGNLTGDKDMKQEGEAQQDKARAERDAAAAEAEAEAARVRAAAHEVEQRGHQSS